MAYMRYAYDRIHWLNKSESLTTPLGKTNLNRMDSAIYNIAENLDVVYNEMSTGKLDKADADKLIVGMPTWNKDTGVFTIRFYDGTTFQIDFNIEKIPVSFSMDSAGVITMATADGTEWTADIGDVIPTYTYEDSDTIAFSDTKDGDYGHVISAEVKKNSITGDYLQPNYLSDVTTQASNAAASAQSASDYADNAAIDAKLAQSYAVGGSGIRDGESTDNAKYHKEKAEQAAQEAGEYLTDLQSVQVTGVKGNNETTYRKGNVNITPANIGLSNVGNYKAVSTVASQGLSETEKANARGNIGAGTSSFSGSYADLSNTPTSLPANGGAADYLNVHLITANVNLNNYKTPGLYYCDANATVKTLTNCPTTNAFYMIVGKHAGYYQEIIEYKTDGPKRFMRNFYNNAWSSWFRVYTEANKPTASEVGALASNTIIPVSNGGTGKKELVDKQVLVGNGTSAVSQIAIDTTSGGTANSELLITSDAVNSGLAKKANNDFKVFRKNETGNFSKTSVTVDSGYTAIMAISQAVDNKANVYSKNFSQSGTVVTVELSTTCNAVYTTVLCVKS